MNANADSVERFQFEFPLLDRKYWAVGGVLFLILATAFVGLRTNRNFAQPSNEFDWESRGMSDFYTMYYYSKAFADGVNPYSAEVMERPEYIVPRNSAPFSPTVFLPYIPLTLLSLKTASVIFFVTSWIMLGALAWCALSMSRIKFDWVLWIWVFALLVFSRPGHVTLFTGYFTVQLALGVVIALHFSRTKPWLSGFGFLIAAVKPTYAIPLTILLLARRDFKATVIGVALTGFFAIGCLAWLASHSDFQSVIDGIKSGQEAFHDDPTEEPVNTWTRVDIAGMAAKVMQRVPGSAEYLGVMMLLLILPCMALWKASAKEAEQGAAGLTALIVVLSLLVTIYHHSYDCLILSVSMIAMLIGSRFITVGIPRKLAVLVGVLLAVPMLNYVSTRAARNALNFEQSDSLWQLITMTNGICLTIALLIAIYFALGPKQIAGTE